MSKEDLAAPVRFELTANGLTVRCSAAELRGNIMAYNNMLASHSIYASTTFG